MAEKWKLVIQTGDEGGGGGGRDSDLPNMFSRKFPEGLRVLLFDKDPQYSHVLEIHLQEFQYEVTRCDEEDRAVYLLCNHRNMFDIAIIEANNLDGRLFQLISEIGSEIDIPIIITSEDCSRESVTKWMRSGVCDYLIKPIRPEDLRLIYKYLVKKMELMTVSGKSKEKTAAEKSSSVEDSTIRNPNKRKGNMLQTDEEDLVHTRGSATKKRRVVWDDYLNGKFLEAMNDLDTRDAVPKKILERMNVSSLTRENVASHLQKFRISQKKQGAQNKKHKRNRPLITPQRGMSSGERNVQFPIHHFNNNPQPSSVQQQNTNLNLMTQRISPLGNHHDDNLMMTHQHHISHQVSAFTCNGQNIEEERMGYNEEEDAINLTSLFTQNTEQMDFLHLEDPLIATTMRFSDIQLAPDPQQMMYAHEPVMVHIPNSFPSSLTLNPFIDQKETITMVDVRGQNVLSREQQQANLANENMFVEADPRSGSARRDKMGQDQGQA